MCLIKCLNKSYKIYHSYIQAMSKILCMYNKMLTRVLSGWCPHSSFSLFQTFYFIFKMHICKERKGRRVRWQPRTSRAHLSLQSPDRLLRKPVKPRVAEPLCSNRSVSGAYFFFTEEIAFHKTSSLTPLSTREPCKPSFLGTFSNGELHHVPAWRFQQIPASHKNC